MHEQKTLNLPWFKNVEPILKLDEIFHQDHVTAFRTLKNIKIPKTTKSKARDSSNSQAKPLPSRKFRIQNIIKLLTNHFADCWEYDKSNSAKLLFYNSYKTKFAREPYLDVSKGFSGIIGREL